MDKIARMQAAVTEAEAVSAAASPGPGAALPSKLFLYRHACVGR